jgi:serine/threonine protein phosphatase 1
MTQTFNFSQTIKPGDIIALSDIHGCYDLYELFLDHVKYSGATVILLGDMIDRARTPGDDIRVLNKTRDLLFDPESWGLQAFYALRGNHEKLFLDAADGYGVGLWEQNGGNVEELDNMAYHQDWINQLPIYITVGETMFVHAGIYPGHNPAEAIADGKADNLVWMREPFLTCGPKFYAWSDNLKQIVFGHTPLQAPMPYRIPHGVCIDTGAYFTGVLTSYNVTRDVFWQYSLDDELG